MVEGELPRNERGRLLNPLITGSAKEAMALGRSLTLIRPKNTRFIAKPKSVVDIAEEKDAFKLAARQTSIFDRELAELEPSPFDFRFQFEDASGSHNYQNGDWETHVMFWRWRELYGEQDALERMAIVYNDEYPRKGMAFALGNQAKRPQTWQLLGVIRLDESSPQGELF